MHSNSTHRAGTDPVDEVFSEGVALLCRKSKAHPALPSYRSYVLMVIRHALIVGCQVTQVTSTGERDAA